jgi:hypothetical protein
MLAVEIAKAGGSDTIVTHRFGNGDRLSLIETHQHLRILLLADSAPKGMLGSTASQKLNITSGLLDIAHKARRG